MVNMKYVPTIVTKTDTEYIRSGKWICKKSPTGAHHWVEDKYMSGIFMCRYCGKSKKFPVIYGSNFKGDVND
jgi:hypothetical protein